MLRNITNIVIRKIFMKHTLLIRDILHDTQALDDVCEMLRAGELVVFPTETVYGLGADARNPGAVRSVFAAKGRPADNPLIVHVPSIEAAGSLVRSLPPVAKRLFERFSPGPLTLVLERGDAVPPEVSAGLDTVAVRIPRHPAALAILRRCGLPVAAPSANLSGKPSPTNFDMAVSAMNGRVSAVVDGGPCELGLESTVARVTEEEVIVLRPGFVTAEMIAAATGAKVRMAQSAPKDAKVSSPGMKYTHYKPEAEVVLAARGDLRAKLNDYAGVRTGVLCLAGTAEMLSAREGLEVYEFANVAEYSAALYGAFVRFDRDGARAIVCETVEDTGVGTALMNRLRKAAGVF